MITRAKTTTWNAIRLNVSVKTEFYEKGVRMIESKFAKLESRLHRTLGIEKWSVCITPKASLDLRARATRQSKDYERSLLLKGIVSSWSALAIEGVLQKWVRWCFLIVRLP